MHVVAMHLDMHGVVVNQWWNGSRWLGHGTMWILSVHGCGFYALWLWEHDWLAGLVWDRNGTNMLAGTLSWLCGCALWFTSLEFVRRKYFEVRTSYARADAALQSEI